MLDLYLTVRSVTPAQKGREALRRGGVRCGLLRAPSALAQRGCGYALALPAREQSRALSLLEEANVRVESVWRKLPEGGFRRERP